MSLNAYLQCRKGVNSGPAEPGTATLPANSLHGVALFVIKYVNLNQQPGSGSPLIDWKLEIVLAS